MKENKEMEAREIERLKSALRVIISTMQGEGLMDSYKPLSASTTNMLIEFGLEVLRTDRDVKEIADEINGGFSPSIT